MIHLTEFQNGENFLLQFLKNTFGSIYASPLIPLLHITALLFFAFVVLKLMDSALKRVRLLIPPGDHLGISRAEQRAATLRGIVRSVVKFALFIFIGLTIAGELGFNTAPLLASVGIVGVAIGFGAQTLFKDVISGFFILLED